MFSAGVCTGYVVREGRGGGGGCYMTSSEVE